MSNFQKNVTNKNFLFEPNIKIKDELVLLINILNDEIKSYFLATKQIILKSKEGINNRINYDYINLIEKQLYLFIQKAKDLFKKMKYVKRQNCFQQQTEKNNNNNQLYNYCNNNFFYYSNAPLATNTNDYNDQPNNNIFQNNSYKKKLIKSPNEITNFNINYYLTRNNSPRYKQQFERKVIYRNKSDIMSDNENSTNCLNKQLNIQNKKSDKDDLIKKILFLLKKLKITKGKIFYETNEAQKYKYIFNTLLGELDKLIKIISNEKIEKEYKCLSERGLQNKEKYEKFINLLNYQKFLLTNNKNEKNKNNNSRSSIKINKTFNNINGCNLINDNRNQINLFNNQNIKLKGVSKSIDEKCKNEIFNNKIKQKENTIFNINKQNKNSLRNKLFKDIMSSMNEDNQEEKNNYGIINPQLVDKEQQTDYIFINIISKEIYLFIEKDSKIINNKQKTLEELKNQIQILKDQNEILKKDLSNSNNQLSLMKLEEEKKNKEINLMKKLIEYNENSISKNKGEKKESIINDGYEELQRDRDQALIKYELLKRDYDRQAIQLKEKEKLLNNYNLYSNIDNSKNIDEKILKLIKKHENEIEELNKKYIRNIINLKVNLPNCFSAETHEILIDKKYTKYNLHWYLLTIISAKEKDYENTFWVSEDEIKDSLSEFNKFNNEDEIEKKNNEDFLIYQQKLIKRIEDNENHIYKLESKLKKENKE